MGPGGSGSRGKMNRVIGAIGGSRELCVRGWRHRCRAVQERTCARLLRGGLAKPRARAEGSPSGTISLEPLSVRAGYCARHGMDARRG